MLLSTTPSPDAGRGKAPHLPLAALRSRSLQSPKTQAFAEEDAANEVITKDAHDRLRRLHEDEGESTEAPSSGLCSDAESWSGAEGGSDSCADDESQPVAHRGCLVSLTLADHKRRWQRGERRLSAASHLRRRSLRAFGSTPLETIPGTPVGMAEHPPLLLLMPPLSGDELDGEEAAQLSGPLIPPASGALLSTAPEPSPNGVGTSPAAWLPPSPKRRACAAFMEKARQDGEPLKVSMLQDMPVMRKEGLDPLMPAKKRPILPEKVSGVAALLGRLESGVPVKKRITPWLTAEPERLWPPVPR